MQVVGVVNSKKFTMLRGMTHVVFLCFRLVVTNNLWRYIVFAPNPISYCALIFGFSSETVHVCYST